MSRERNFFPMMVRLQGRKCLVVGAGKIGADKVAGLLAHGARIVVISPRAVPEIRDLARKGKVQWRRRVFTPEDVQDAFLVVSATNSVAVNEAVFRACRAYSVLCNAVDDPARCDFFYPAIVHRGPLQIAISTNGRSPALAARLRQELEKQFGPEWGDWVEHVGEARRQVFKRKISSVQRRKKLLQMASPKAFLSFKQARSRKK